jgi:hypothetical protein
MEDDQDELEANIQIIEEGLFSLKLNAKSTL